MLPTRLLRAALWFSVPANLGVAALLLVPGSAAGRLAGLPTGAPLLYSSLLALFVALFGLAYAWLAWQPRIARPLLAMATFGKAGAFLLCLALWLGGEASGRWLLLTVGDLLLAAVFAGWLWTHREGDALR